MNRDSVSLLNECIECLRVILVHKHNELDPHVVQELYAILHQLEVLSASESKAEMPPVVWEEVWKVIGKAALTISAVKRLFDLLDG